MKVLVSPSVGKVETNPSVCDICYYAKLWQTEISHSHLVGEVSPSVGLVPFSRVSEKTNKWIHWSIKRHFKEIKMDLEKLIDLHDNLKDSEKICSCNTHTFHQQCENADQGKERDKCSEDHEVMIKEHPKHDLCNCTLAVAIRTFQLKTIGQMIDHGSLTQTGEVIRRVDLGLDGSTVTPKSFMAIHSELYNYMNGMDESAILSLHHQMQKLIDHARVGDGIVIAFYSDRLKRLTEEKRAELREQDKEFDKTHKYDSSKNEKSEAKKADIKDQLKKLLAQMKALNAGK